MSVSSFFLNKFDLNKKTTDDNFDILNKRVYSCSIVVRTRNLAMEIVSNRST